jgi:hypothetical protein
MSELTNEQRADAAYKALQVFLRKMFYCNEPDKLDPEDLEDAISDLIADLFHLAHQKGFDIDSISRQAEGNFREELDEEASAELDEDPDEESDQPVCVD